MQKKNLKRTTMKRVRVVSTITLTISAYFFTVDPNAAWLKKAGFENIVFMLQSMCNYSIVSHSFLFRYSRRRWDCLGVKWAGLTDCRTTQNSCSCHKTKDAYSSLYYQVIFIVMIRHYIVNCFVPDQNMVERDKKVSQDLLM